MRSASLQRIENMRRLVAALAQRSMGPRVVAELLNISDSAARAYLKALAEAGVAHHDPSGRTRLRLGPDPAVQQAFLSALAARAEQQQVALRRSTARHCTNPGKAFLHVLADDVRFPLVLHRHPAHRDPLVAALFGAAAGMADRK